MEQASRARARVLLHIGYPKTGTTWLQQRLLRDPEAGFFSLDWNTTDAHAVFVRQDPLCFDAAWARGQFERELARAERSNLTFVISHERYAGSPAGGGYDSRPIADRLVETFPEARCLIVLREQTSMLCALHAQYVEDGGYLSLSRFLHPPNPYGAVPGFRFELLNYDRLISYYRRKLGPENVLALPFELFRVRPQEFIDRITEFCGAGRYRYVPERVINPRRSHLYLQVKRRVNLLVTRSQLSNFSPIHLPYLKGGFILAAPVLDAVLPAPLNDWLDRRVRRRVTAAVGGRYRQSNRHASALIGIDLGELGYDCAPGTAEVPAPAGRVGGRNDPVGAFAVRHAGIRKALAWWLSGRA